MGSIASPSPKRRKRLDQADILVMLAAGLDPTDDELDEANVARFRTVPPRPRPVRSGTPRTRQYFS